MKPDLPKTSDAWGFFKKEVHDEEVECTLCKKTLAFHDGTTDLSLF